MDHKSQLATSVFRITEILLFAVILGSCGDRKATATPPPRSPPVIDLGKLDFDTEDPKIRILTKEAIALEEQHNDHEGAIKKYMDVLKLAPNRPQTMNSIAGAYGKLGNFQEEIKWANEAIKIAPSFYPAHINLGTAYAEQGNFAAAREAYAKARSINPQDPRSYYSLGLIDEREKNVDSAIQNYRKSVEIDPTFVDGHFNLAAIYANQQDFELAAKELETVLALDPAAEDAKSMLIEVNKHR